MNKEFIVIILVNPGNMLPVQYPADKFFDLINPRLAMPDSLVVLNKKALLHFYGNAEVGHCCQCTKNNNVEMIVIRIT